MFNSMAKVGKLDDLEKYIPQDEESEPVELTPEQEEKLWMLVATPIPKVD